jgi:iron complex outermembrane receptor protein
MGIYPFLLNAQTADSLELKTLIISAEKTSGIPALKTIELDSTVLSLSQMQSLGRTLQNYSAISIKTYGTPGIQTPTFRGMSASHTKVYFNGLDISPGSLGQSDLSIIPGFLFDEIGVKYGNAAFTEGVGAIGGGVMLKSGASKSAFGNSILLGGSIGSFGNQSIYLKYGYKSQKWESITKYIYQNSKNDFTYRNIAQPDAPETTQEHAKNKLHGLRQSFKYHLDSKNVISMNLIASWVDRDIPGLMTNIEISDQTQNDKLLVAQVGWKNYGKSSQSDLVMGYNYSVLDYIDPSSQIYSTTVNKKFQVREDYVYNLNKKWALNATANWGWASAENVNYSGNNQQMVSSVLLGVNGHITKKWEAGVFVQPTWNGIQTNSLGKNAWEYETDLLPMISIAYLPKGNKKTVIGLNMAQNVHYPTLNDLYWVPGGNPDLKPELASNAELNVHTEGVIRNKIQWNFDGSGYYGNVDNWILWQPTDKGYWSAQNLKSVEHYGGEGKVGLMMNYLDWKFGFTTGYQYVRAVNKNVNDASLNKQLIYTPKHSANWLLNGSYKNFGVFVNYNFTGRRYVTSSNTTYLPEYDIVNLMFTYQIRKSKIPHFEVQLDINNILDKEYMSVVWRAMPGINWQFTIRYRLN